MTRRAQSGTESVVEKLPKFTKNPAEWGMGGDVAGIWVTSGGVMSHKYMLCDINKAMGPRNKADQCDYRNYLMSHNTQNEDPGAAGSRPPLCLVNLWQLYYTPRAKNSDHFAKIRRSIA